MKTSYLYDLDIGEEGGRKNLLVTPKTLIEALSQKNVRLWMTVADATALTGKSEATLYRLIHKGVIPTRFFKKREADHRGICLVSVHELLAVHTGELWAGPRQYVAVLKKNLREAGVLESQIAEFVSRYEAALDLDLNWWKQEGMKRDVQA
jgi:hypothetical protein